MKKIFLKRKTGDDIGLALIVFVEYMLIDALPRPKACAILPSKESCFVQENSTFAESMSVSENETVGYASAARSIVVLASSKSPPC